MFGRYILKNIKHHLLSYILIFILETMLICVSLTASGIAFNAMVGRNYYTLAMAKEFSFSVNKTTAGEFRDVLSKFINALPVPYAKIKIELCNEEVEKFSHTYVFFQYPDYETMCKQLAEGPWKLELSEMPTREQFENNEPVAIVGNNAGSHFDMETGTEIRQKYDFTDANHIMLSGKEYLVTGRFQSHGVHILFDIVPDDVRICGFEMQLPFIPNRELINEIKVIAMEHFELRDFREPLIDRLLDWRYSEANIMLSVLVIFMSVFNVLLAFKYLLSSRQKYFAVLRLCGFKKSVCIVYSFAELLMTSIISSLASFFIFRYGLSPFLARYYSVFGDVVFSSGYYAVLYGFFFAANVILFAVYIAPSLSKSVSEELNVV